MKGVTCKYCFVTLPEKDIAHICQGLPSNAIQDRPIHALPLGLTLQQNRYQIGAILGQGGFGITYLGYDLKLKRRLAIKEYFPMGMVMRTQGNRMYIGEVSWAETVKRIKTEFLEEAQLVASVQHPNLVEVYDYFEENETAYIVMPFYEGETLSQRLARKIRGYMPESEAVGYILPILDALSVLHQQNYLHLDIKPDNIYIIRATNQPLLLDFGLAKSMNELSEHSRTPILTPNYAPLEQHRSRFDPTPATDIYSVAATLFHLVTGQPPTRPLDRLEGDKFYRAKEIVSFVSDDLDRALAQALSILIRDRPQSLYVFKELLSPCLQSKSPMIGGRNDAVTSIPSHLATTQKVEGVRKNAKSLIKQISLYTWKEKARRAKLPQQRIDASTHALEYDPSNREMLLLRGMTALEIRSWANALSDFERILNNEPSNAKYYHYVAICNKELGQHEQALVFLDRSIELGPHFEAYEMRAQIRYDLKQYQEAHDDLNICLTYSPQNAHLYYLRGNTLQALECYEAAIFDYERSLSLEYETPHILHSLKGWALEQVQQFSLAFLSYQQALKLVPNYSFAKERFMHLYGNIDQQYLLNRPSSF